jgi:phage major head subunit gpT-like protein
VEITFPGLSSINNGVTLAFNSQLFAAQTIYDRFTYQATSTGASEVYPRLDMLFGLREWIGDRVVRSLTNVTFTIANRTFEETIGIAREDIEDDKYGILSPVAEQLGQNAARLPDLLVAQLLKAGHTTLCYDGQNFFDTSHMNADNSGTVANYSGTGAYPVWYLFDTTRVVKPVIFQRRRPFQVIPKFSMTDPQVFWNKEFEWGVDGRCNVGFGIWQLGYMSTLQMTHDNVLAARTAMAGYRRPDGSPMGITPNLLVTGSANYPIAKALAENEFQPTSASATSLVPNQIRGMFTALEDQWLN